VCVFLQSVPLQKLAFERGLKVRHDPVSGRIVLTDSTREVVLTRGGDIALVDGRVVRLSQPVRYDQEGLLVPKEVEGFFARAAPRKKRKKRKFVVVLDAGHGGRFRGAVANGVVEKDLNLDVVRRVAELLKKDEAIRVVLTRSRDSELDENWSRDLDARVEVAHRVGADLFVSVHFNATGGRRPDVSGIEVYIAREEEDVERRVGRAMREAASTLKHLGVMSESPRSDTAWILHRMLLERKYRESLKAARCFVKALSQNDKDHVRGIFARGFRVVKWTRCPAVLLELGYITNPETAARLKTVNYRQILANLVACGIRDYIKTLKEATKKPQHTSPQAPSTKEEKR